MALDDQPELTNEQIAQLEEAKKRIPQILTQITRAERAGLNMDKARADVEGLQKQVESMVRVYGRRTISPL